MDESGTDTAEVVFNQIGTVGRIWFSEFGNSFVICSSALLGKKASIISM